MPDVDLLVVDEAHHSGATKFKDLVKKYPRRIGLTATPWRMRGEMQFTRFEDELEWSYNELVKAGFLAEYNWVREDLSLDWWIGAGRPAIRAGEFTDASLKALYKDKKWLDELSAAYTNASERARAHPEGYVKALCFAPNHDAAYELGRVLKRHGEREIRVVHSGSRTREGTNPQELRETIEEFKRANSRIEVVINVNLFKEGLDVPGINLVMVRPTLSKGFFFQMMGRGMRRDGDKKEFELIAPYSAMSVHGNALAGEWELPSPDEVDEVIATRGSRGRDGKRPPTRPNSGGDREGEDDPGTRDYPDWCEKDHPHRGPHRHPTCKRRHPHRGRHLLRARTDTRPERPRQRGRDERAPYVPRTGAGLRRLVESLEREQEGARQRIARACGVKASAVRWYERMDKPLPLSFREKLRKFLELRAENLNEAATTSGGSGQRKGRQRGEREPRSSGYELVVRQRHQGTMNIRELEKVRKEPAEVCIIPKRRRLRPTADEWVRVENASSYLEGQYYENRRKGAYRYIVRYA